MKNIYETHGEITYLYLAKSNIYATIDTDKVPLVSQYNWHEDTKPNKASYVKTNIGKGKNMRLHRLIFGLPNDKGMAVHHKNHDTLDNRLCNLSLVSHRENSKNRYQVFWKPNYQRWIALVKYEGVVTFSNMYETREEGKKEALKYLASNGS